MSSLIAAGAVSFILSVSAIPLIIFFSNKYKIFDSIDERKVHTGNISRLGGIAILTAFSTAVLILSYHKVFSSITQDIRFLVPALFCILVMGVLDDILNIRARIKLLAQITAASLVLAGGFKFTGISFHALNIHWQFGLFAYPLTFIWIIGVTNAVNLIDGIDGLSGSLTVISALTYAVIFYKLGNSAAIAVCIALACSVSGFLVYNLPLPKAKIFMGDGGSQFSGFVLSVLPLISVKGTETTISIVYASLILILPIFDTFAAIIRRTREHRRIDSPDKFHLHHKLMMMGFSARAALAIICLFQLVISIFICCAVWIGGVFSFTLVVTVFIMGLLFFSVIHFAKSYMIQENSEKHQFK